jgi:hypothetical protein
MRHSAHEADTNNVVCWSPIHHGCWSISERVQIDRVRFICEKSSKLEFDGGHSDEGDPWCIVYNRQREQVVLHIARIDRWYVVVRESHSKPLIAALLSEAINAALNDLDGAGTDRRTA